MLSPDAINRAVDLIRLGPLSIDAADLELAEKRLVTPWTTRWVSVAAMWDEVHEIAKRRGRTFDSERYGGYLVRGVDSLHSHIFDERGSVRGRHWKPSGATFAQYMSGDFVLDIQEGMG